MINLILVISLWKKKVSIFLFIVKKKFNGIINIHIQNPKISAKNFNYIVAPNHDNFYGNNVFNSIGALTSLLKKLKYKRY